MRITCLAENTCQTGNFPTEHGLSLYIETEEKRILFDMGQSDLFLENAKCMGIDLCNVDFAVLSHGHYDHGGGLPVFLSLNEHAKVYVSPHAFEPHYNGTEKYIGLDTALSGCERLVYTEEIHPVCPGVTLYHCTNGKTRKDTGTFGLNVLENGVFLPEDFRHEQYLLIEEHGQKVLFSGCSHRGILNIAPWFMPDVLVGGFHFSKLPADDILEEYARELSQYPTAFYTCHCTGEEQFVFMKRFMTNLFYLSTGDCITL